MFFREKAGSTVLSLPVCSGSKNSSWAQGQHNHSVWSISAQFCSSTSSVQNSPLLLQATGIPLPAPEMEGDCEIQRLLSTAGAGDIREPGKGRSTGSPWLGGKEGCGSAHTTGWGLVLTGRSRRKNCILLRDTHDHLGSGFTEHPTSIPFLIMSSTSLGHTLGLLNLNS